MVAIEMGQWQCRWRPRAELSMAFLLFSFYYWCYYCCCGGGTVVVVVIVIIIIIKVKIKINRLPIVILETNVVWREEKNSVLVLKKYWFHKLPKF